MAADETMSVAAVKRVISRIAVSHERFRVKLAVGHHSSSCH
jgi:hypothetical protein